MQDNYLDGVTPPVHKRTIRDIPIPAHRQRKHVKKHRDINLKKTNRNSHNDDEIPSDESMRRKEPEDQSRNLKPKLLYGFVLVVIFASVIFGMNLFSKAQVEILTKTESLANLNTSFAISPVDEVDTENEIPYQEIRLQKTSSAEVNATEEEFIEEKSSGIITIYNEYSSSPQTLVEKTRFESPDGKIYRIPESVTVPGMETVDGVNNAGKLDVEVFADKTGEDYNIDNQDIKFNIPGFEGQEQYDVFYAISKEPIDGGFNGIKKIVSEEDMLEATENLKNEVKKQLVNEINEQLPKNLLAVYNENSFNFSDIKQKDVKADSVTLELSGNLNLITFDKASLAKKIAGEQLIDYRPGENIEITNLDELETNLDLENQRIAVIGDVDFRWKNDIEKLKEDLSGVSENSIRKVFTSYRGIISVDTKISPFWKNSFPNNPERIIVQEK